MKFAGKKPGDLIVGDVIIGHITKLGVMFPWPARGGPGITILTTPIRDNTTSLYKTTIKNNGTGQQLSYELDLEMYAVKVECDL